MISRLVDAFSVVLLGVRLRVLWASLTPSEERNILKDTAFGFIVDAYPLGGGICVVINRAGGALACHVYNLICLTFLDVTDALNALSVSIGVVWALFAPTLLVEDLVASALGLVGDASCFRWELWMEIEGAVLAFPRCSYDLYWSTRGFITETIQTKRIWIIIGRALLTFALEVQHLYTIAFPFVADAILSGQVRVLVGWAFFTLSRYRLNLLILAFRGFELVIEDGKGVDL